MNNYQKYFGSLDLVAKTLDDLIYNNEISCCNFCAHKHCKSFHKDGCITGIKQWLEKESEDD